MRSLVASLLLVCALSAPVNAAGLHPIASMKARVTELKAQLGDKVQRKKLIGKVAFGSASAFVGGVAQHTLQHFGVDPFAASFAAGVVVSAGGYYAQRGLAKVSHGYLDAPEPVSHGRLVVDSVIGGALGIAGQAGVDKLAALAPRISLPGGALAHAGRTVLNRVVVQTVKGATWVRGKAVSTAIGAGSDQLLEQGHAVHERLRDRAQLAF